VFCVDCKKALMRQKMVYKSEKTAVWFYDCRTYHVQKLCTKKFIREADLNMAVYDAVRFQLDLCADISRVISKLNEETSHKSRLAGFDLEIEEAEKELKRIQSLRKAVFEDYAAKLLTLSEYQFASEKYNSDADAQSKRLESAKQAKKQFRQTTTSDNKWLAHYGRFVKSKELTPDMAQSLIERVEVGNDSNIHVVFKFADEFMALQAMIGADCSTTNTATDTAKGVKTP